MVEARINIDGQFIFKWLESHLIKLVIILRDQLELLAEWSSEEFRFLMEFEYSRSNIIEHLCQKASQFFGYDPDEKGRLKRKLSRRKRLIKKKKTTYKKNENEVKRPSNSFGNRKKSKKNRNYFIPKTE